MRRFFTNTRGDTIVEVLIAIVILALVLTGAFASSEQSLNNITEAGQRTKALDIAQGQVESLRANAATTAFSSAGCTTGSCCYSTTTDTFVAYSPANCTTSGGYISKVSSITVPVNSYAVGVSTFEITVYYSASANQSAAIEAGANDRVVLYYTVATS